MDGFRSVAGAGPKFWDAGVTQQAQDAASVTANLLQAHPNISVVFTWGADTSVGALQAAREAGRTDPKKFFIGSIDVTDEQIGQIATGTTVMQGAATFPLRFSAVAMERGIERAMLGQYVPPTGYVKPFVITKDNALEYLRASNHQLIPENQHYFDELMVYFDAPVKTGDPFPDESTGYVWDGARTAP
jgi:ABC-type sugar transport system substrate-binding protein